MKNLISTLTTFAFVAGFAAATPGYVFAQTPDAVNTTDKTETAETAETNGTKPVAIDANKIMLNPESLAQERAANALISQDSVDAGGIYSGREIAEISLRKAAVDAIAQNLSVRQSVVSKKISKLAIDEAKAVFDPVLTVSVTLDKTRYFERTEHPDKYKRSTDANNRIYFSEESPIQYLQYNAARPAGFYPTTERASEKPASGSQAVSTYLSTNLGQTTPWGQYLNLNVTNTFARAKWVANDDTNGRETVGEYKRPWTTTGAASISSSLPATRGFGSDNSSNVAVDTAKMYDALALWSVRSTINSTLYNVDVAFWNLAGAMQKLKTAHDVVSQAANLKNRTNRLFNAGRNTKTDMAQVESQTEVVQASYTQAVQDVLTASAALNKLLDRNDGKLVLPVGYLALLQQSLAFDESPSEVLNSPAYMMQMVNMEIVRRLEDARQNEAKPNLYVNTSVTAKQSNSVFGYATAEESMMHLFDPDTLTFTAGLYFTRPLGNVAAKEALSQARMDVTRQQLVRSRLESSLRNTFETARIAVQSARERRQIAARNAKLAKSVYDRATRMQQARRVTEYEVTEKLIALLNAQNTHTNAAVAEKQAESQYLASLGNLPEHYAARTSQSEFDIQRLQALSDIGALFYFGGEDK